jgi:hypothetical protein
VPPVKPIHQVQGQALRKLRLLLQRWWQEHSQNKLDTQDTQDTQDSQNTNNCRDSYLSCALLFGAAHYLTNLDRDRDRDRGPEQNPAQQFTFASALAILQNLWPRALNHTTTPSFLHNPSWSQVNALVADPGLQKQFLALTKHRLVGEIFISPLCPSFIYEAFSFKERRTSKDLLQDEKKLVDTCHLISFTQVYTPTWVVDHLLQNTLGKALSENLDLSQLLNMTLLDPALGGGVFLVQALSLCARAYQDFGLTAYEATKHSLKSNLFGLDIDSQALSTAALALILKAFSLGLSEPQVQDLLPFVNLCLIEEERDDENQGEREKGFPMGSLSKHLRKVQDHILSKRYDVVVANPPYLGRKLLPRPLKEKLRRYYPEAASDLSQAFLSMALDLAKPGGRVGFITQGSFLHLANAKSLREKILIEHQLIQVVELGSGVFPLLPGEKASTALIIIRNNMPPVDQTGHFLSLVATSDKSSLLKVAPSGSEQTSPDCIKEIEKIEKSEKIDRFETIRRQSDFLKDQDRVINYLRPPVVTRLRSRLPKLADIATLKQGLATTNNARFLRYIWEINSAEMPDRFVPYARGEGAERWWSPLTTAVLWESNGLAIKEAVTAAYPYLKGNYAWVVKNEEYYFRSGLTFSFVSKDRLAVRKLAAGAIFDVGSSAIFVDNCQGEGALLAYLNSDLATALAHDLNPTINFQVGDLKKLVIPDFSPAEQERLSTLADSCVAAKEKLFALSSPLRFFQPAQSSLSAQETSLDRSITEDSFNLVQRNFDQATEELSACEKQIDQLVMLATTRDASLDEKDRRAIEDFADRPKQKTNNSLGGERFCLIGLIEAMLRYFYKTDLSKTDSDKTDLNKSKEIQPRALIASLKHEGDADCFINFWPGIFDLNFVRAHLGQGKGLAQYIREDLPQAFDDYFLGQPPLLFIKTETIIIVPPFALLHPAKPNQWIVAECGDLSLESRSRALDVLHRAKNITGLKEMRAKEMVRALTEVTAVVQANTAEAF